MMQKFCIAIFPLNSLQNQQQKMDHAEILHFNFEIWMQKFGIAIFPLNSLKVNNKWIMQEICISTLTLTKSGCKNSAESFSR